MNGAAAAFRRRGACAFLLHLTDCIIARSVPESGRLTTRTGKVVGKTLLSELESQNGEQSTNILCSEISVEVKKQIGAFCYAGSIFCMIQPSGVIK